MGDMTLVCLSNQYVVIQNVHTLHALVVKWLMYYCCSINTLEVGSSNPVKVRYILLSIVMP